MYASDNDPTQMIYRTGSSNQRRLWLAVGAGVLAIAVLTFLIALAFTGRDGRADAALGAPVTPTTSEPVGDSDSEDGQSGGLGGNQDAPGPGGDQGNPGGGGDPGQPNPGGGDDPGEDPGGDPGEDPDEDPGEEIPQFEVIPLLPTISASVNKPGPLVGCVLTTAKITVTGVLFAPMEIKYQFVKFGFVDQPLGSVKTVVFDQPGEQTVAAPLPKNSDGHLIYLQISAPQEIKSDIVLYPACG